MFLQCFSLRALKHSFLKCRGLTRVSLFSNDFRTFNETRQSESTPTSQPQSQSESQLEEEEHFEDGDYYDESDNDESDITELSVLYILAQRQHVCGDGVLLLQLCLTQ